MPCYLCEILKVQAAGGIDRGPEENGRLSLRYAFFNCRETRRQGDIHHDGHKARFPKEGPRFLSKEVGGYYRQETRQVHRIGVSRRKAEDDSAEKASR